MSKFFRLLSPVLMIVALFSSMLPVSFVRATDAGATTEPFRAIAKIRTFTNDQYSDLSEVSNGSGVVISESGLLLTNNHVIENKSSFDNSDLPTSYVICLPDDMVREPDCSYTAKVIAKNEDLDVALLQIQAIPDLSSKSSFPYLNLAQTDNANTNDPITAIGYPGIGGSTVTTTQGIVSGKTEKYGHSWIKTDAIISFGSSGGAALDATHTVIGITSAGYSDLLGSLGYVINITSLNNWIDTNKNNSSVNSSLLDKTEAFIKKEKTINDVNFFQNPDPNFTIVKPADWEFKYIGENDIYITNPSDSNGGFVEFYVSPSAYLADVNSIVPHLKRKSVESGDIGLFKINEDTNVKINKVAAKKIRYTNKIGQDTIYAVPFRNHIVFMSYDYGQDDQDKTTIENIVQSLTFSKTQKAFAEKKSFSNSDPKINFSVDKDWVLQQRNDLAKPAYLLNKKYRDMFATVEIKKLTDETKTLNNEGLIKRDKDLIESANKILGVIDLNFQITETNAHYKVNKNVTDVIKEVFYIKTPSNKKVVVYEMDYAKKISDKYVVTFSFVSTNPDKKKFTEYQKEFNRVLQNLTFAAPVAPKVAVDTDKDGLSDADEKKYGTDPKNPDTDHDGFKDGEEVKNGYNPLGKGKLKK